ncbi:hypothetical protein AVEN_77756-1, partial [Araneus ventricosus]
MAWFRIPGLKPDSSEETPCILTWFTLTPTSRVKPPHVDVVRWLEK